MTGAARVFVTAILMVVTAWAPAFAESVVSQIERMASLGSKAEDSLVESIHDGIEKDPTTVSKALLPRLNDKTLSESQLVTHVWALGLTKDHAATDTIEALYRQSTSTPVKLNCLNALASIGGPRAGDFLLSALNATTDQEERFDILNLLGQMQYEKALPKTEEILKKDPDAFYWQSIFVFGKMGDKGVPFLLERIGDKERNVRINTINVLGMWLISRESAKPIQAQFWIEKDLEVRDLILSALEMTITDLAQMKTFFELVATKEKEEKLVKFARETLTNLEEIKTIAAKSAKLKKPSATSFEKEYATLFKSAGKEGSYEALGISSTIQDEAKLKSLRERILQRNSDEAFYDYRKVNEIMIKNRWVDSMEKAKP